MWTLRRNVACPLCKQICTYPTTTNSNAAFQGRPQWNLGDRHSYKRRASSSAKSSKEKRSEPIIQDCDYNAAKIQMLSEGIRKQVFRGDRNEKVDAATLNKVINHLKKFKLWDTKTISLKEVDFKLPELVGADIDSHFRQLASEQSGPYVEQAESIRQLVCLPPKPKEWLFRSGWTRYDAVSGEATAVGFPDEQSLIFDVEVLVPEGQYPTLATAASTTAWYSWCSERLVEDKLHWRPPDLQLSLLIPLETAPGTNHPPRDQWQPKLVIGHNVGYDRSFIKEQYYIQGTKARFVDTMSLHIAVSGLTSLQRILYVAHKTGSRRKEVIEHEQDQATFGHAASYDWMQMGSLNSLADVYQLYCKGPPLDKSTRDVFVKGTISDVRQQFQKLMIYCAEDVSATHAVFKAVWPQFRERFPHPVTLAGMLEMGTAYLPVNKNWKSYINSSQAIFEKQQQEMNLLLQNLANQACGLMEDERYKDNVWLWDLDWTTKALKYKKAVTTKSKKPAAGGGTPAEGRVEEVLSETRQLFKKQPHMPGYPGWYAELCPKGVGEDRSLGPSLISTQRRISPKLLNLTWDGYPLHYDATHGWGFLVPRIYKDENVSELSQLLDHQEELVDDHDDDGKKKKPKKTPSKSVVNKQDFPHKALFDVVMETRPDWLRDLRQGSYSQQKAEQLLEEVQNSTGEEDRGRLWAQYNEYIGKQSKWSRGKYEALKPTTLQPGIGPYSDILPVCDFYKLPHKDGSGKKVGNPLAKDFLSKIEEGILRSRSGSDAETILKYSKKCAYWKNNLKRISSQMAVALSREELPKTVLRSADYVADSYYGAILPRVVTAGTVTRRAVESTWMTASNAYEDRIGSELKAMVQSPPGYHFVGADVDSQELWIAAILGDTYFAGVHGSSAFGWMTLQGNKAEGSDLHSRTAALVGITRDHAKVFTYGRIYGAGVRFAEQLLRQFNHRLTQSEAKRKARVMYESTKGKRLKYDPSFADDEDINKNAGKWEGGSESHMFNMLENIATSAEPRTPVLGCMISKSLEPKNVAGDFMTSRVNWVVQSSAVDYLHLMLVSMRWLLETYSISGRFSISIHDEVRYLVSSPDRHRAAQALQVTNLLTRAMFAFKLGLNDLPQSVAFFSAVDIDTCLRKEVHMDCVTPSNPQGLHKGYGIPPGNALTIHDIINLTSGSLDKEPSHDSDEEIDLEEFYQAFDDLSAYQ